MLLLPSSVHFLKADRVYQDPCTAASVLLYRTAASGLPFVHSSMLPLAALESEKSVTMGEAIIGETPGGLIVKVTEVCLSVVWSFKAPEQAQ